MRFKDFINESGAVDVSKVQELSEEQRAALVQMSVVWAHIDTYEGVKRKVEWYRDQLKAMSSWAESQLMAEMNKDIKLLQERIDDFQREFTRLEQTLQSSD